MDFKVIIKITNIMNSIIIPIFFHMGEIEI